jgi:ubiquinone/menaquinone biosynthesis C-methylase UbiE
MHRLMKSSSQNLAFQAFWTILAVVGGLVFFWLFPLKLFARLAARFGHSSPCPAALSRLVDNRLRRRYMRPVVDRIGIEPGERVLELGPGPGAFTLGAARRAGQEGRLIAVDIQPEMIAQVEQRVSRAGLCNVETRVANAHALPLDDESVDRAFLITVLPEIPEPARALAELHRVLRPGGVLSITEEFYDPDYLFASETIRLAEAAGFRFEERFGNILVYTANFRKTT